MKKIIILLSALVMAFTVPALAAEETGSINITLSADNKAVDVSDGTFRLYQVADIVKADNGDYVYRYTEDFAGCGYTIDVDDADLPQELLMWAGQTGVSYVKSATPAHGKLAFTDIPQGLYLVAQSTASEGYYAALPFLVSVPLYENGAWVYSVDASPKMELIKRTTEANPPATHTGTQGTASTHTARTGDQGHLFLYGLLVIAATLVIVAVLRRRADQAAR